MKRFLTLVLLIVALLVTQAYNARSADSDTPEKELIKLKRKYQSLSASNDEKGAGLALQRMAELCLDQGHYAMALDYYQKAEKIFVNLGNKDLIADNLSDMGRLYYYNRQNDIAYTTLQRALQLYKGTHNEKGTADVLGKIGHHFEKQGKKDSAFYYQRKSLRIFCKMGDAEGTANILENIGSIFEDLGSYDSAAVYYQKSYKLYLTTDNKAAIIGIINNLGDIKRKTGHYAEGIAFGRQAYSMAKIQNNRYQLSSSAKDLALNFRYSGQPDSAFLYMEMARKYSLELYSTEANRQTAFLSVLYDIDRQNAEIAKLENDRKFNYFLWAAAVLLAVLLAVLSAVIISRQRLKIKDHLTLSRQKDLEKETMELELKNRSLEEQNLKQQLELKMRELSVHTLAQVKTYRLLEELRTALQNMIKDEKRDQKRQMQQLVELINNSFTNDAGWLEFTRIFEQVHQRFFDKIKKIGAELTASDLRLIALLKLNISSPDIATLLGISQDSLRVARYRLRKKLELPQGDNLILFIQTL